MDPKRRPDSILSEWRSVSATARRPAKAPRPQRGGTGSALGLVGAGLLAAGLVVAIGVSGAGRSSGVASQSTPSPSTSAVAVAGSPSTAPSAAPSTSPSAAATAIAAPSRAPATPRPSAAPTAAPECRMSDLAARIMSWEGAAGNRIASINLTSQASVNCRITALPVPALVDAAGRVLVTGPGSPAGGRLTLRPGEVVTSDVDVSNVCGQAPKTPLTIAFDMGAAQPLVAAPLSATDDTVPPCNGPNVPASIQMHPWSR